MRTNQQYRIPRNAREVAQMAERSCTAWNNLYSVGTRVRLYLGMLGDEKNSIETVTRSQAWVMGGHSAMIMVQGKTGGWSLTHVRPLLAQSQHPQGEIAAALALDQDTAAQIASLCEMESGVAA